MNGFTSQLTSRFTSGRPWLAAAGVAVAVSLAGCAGWQSWPPRDDEPASLSPNSAVALDVMEAALRWAVDRRPPKDYDGPIALNLPVGLTEVAYQGVARHVGRGTVPLSTQTTDLPIYHIVSFRVRVNEAQVELLRPALPISAYTDELRADPEAYEGYILTLKGKIGGWSVDWFRERTPGVMPVPVFNYIDAPTQPVDDETGDWDEGEWLEEDQDPATDESGEQDPAEAARRARETATGG